MADGSTIQTFFKDAVMKNTPMSGNNVVETNGADIRDGQKGDSRTMPEVTTVNVKDGDSPGPGLAGGKDITGQQPAIKAK